jgi:hypothetical protein
MTLYLTAALSLMTIAALTITYQTHRSTFGRYSPTRLAVAATTQLRHSLQHPRRDENGLSNITSDLAMVALGVVLLVGLFALLTGFAGKVITYIQNQLGIS